MRFLARFVCALGLAVTLSGASLPAGEKKVSLSPDNTKISWVGTKPAGGKHDGGFDKFSGTLEAAGTKVSKINLEIDANSITSDTPKLTKHLKSADFFEVLNFAKCTFVSTKIEGDGKVTVTGDLTIRGMTKSITFPATVSSDGGFQLTSSFTISKKAFGMTYGEGKIDDAVTIKVSVKAK